MKTLRDILKSLKKTEDNALVYDGFNDIDHSLKYSELEKILKHVINEWNFF